MEDQCVIKNKGVHPSTKPVNKNGKGVFSQISSHGHLRIPPTSGGMQTWLYNAEQKTQSWKKSSCITLITEL